MKVLFFISAYGGTASGGHFNSLNQVSLEMANTCEVKIIMLGKLMSPVIKDNPYLERHLKLGHGIKDVFRLNTSLRNFFETFKPDVIHCFDTRSLNLILLTSSTKGIPVVMNKCGGPNPDRKNYQHSDATVVFSFENLNWYLESKYYDNESIFCIPNRVRQLNLPAENVDIEKADSDKITFLRVSRLGGVYEMTLLQTFKLLDKLKEFLNVELIVVGRVQNEDRFSFLKSEAEKMDFNVRFITDERASKGADFLNLADFVIGTGRSFMEATSLGIPTLTPAKNTSIPILVTAENVDNFLRTNFSERNIASDHDEKNTIEDIIKLTSSEIHYSKFQTITRGLFKEYFGTEKINEKYTEVYKFAINKSLSRTKLLFENFPYLVRFILVGK